MSHRTSLSISLFPLCSLFAACAIALGACSSGGGGENPQGSAGQSGTAGQPGATGKGGSSGPAGAPGHGGTTGAAGGGGSAPLLGCTPKALDSSGTLQGRYGTTHVTSDGRDYFLQVNQWNTGASGNQTMSYGGSSFFKMTTQTATAATNGSPTGFPSVFIGANANHSTTGSNLPKQVSALTQVLTTWNWNDAGTRSDTTNNSYNATYDVWFSTNAGGDPSASAPSGGYLMVWLHRPNDAQPIGSISALNQTIPGVPGGWDVWVGMNGSKPCISYVSRSSTLSLSYDLNNFIKDAVTNRSGTIQSGWYLSNVFAGFEIWRGGMNIETTSFCAVVQ
jgi:hypothetical protein